MNAPAPEEIFGIKDDSDFEAAALRTFMYQSEACAPYRKYIELMGIDRNAVKDIFSIPFLPISFFKDHLVYSGEMNPETVFTSSGTSGMARSCHAVKSLSVYEESLRRTFNLFYGNPKKYAIMGLLPSYLSRKGSSLIYMVKKLQVLSGCRYGGFYLKNHRKLLKSLDQARKDGFRVLLIGVTYALLDLAEKHPCDLHDVIIMETGGMKGRRKEMVREEVHDILKNAFNVRSIHSEYGMTELLSQAYSKGEGIFNTPPWMKVMIRDSHDPLSHSVESGTSGGISVIDLANIWSCSFIATSDLGRIHENGSFEVLGRFDNSDLRGCNLMVT